MRTTEDLTLAAAILWLNIHTDRASRRIVSSIEVYRTWHLSSPGGFAEGLFSRTQRKDRLIELINELPHLKLSTAAGALQHRLDYLSETLFASAIRSRATRSWITDALEVPPQLPEADQELVSTNPSPNTTGSHLAVADYRPLPTYTSQGFGVTVMGTYTPHSVFFGTDRLAVVTGSKITFGDERNTAGVTYGKAEVSIPHAHKEGSTERPKRRFMLFPASENPNKHIVIHKTAPCSLDEWIESAKLENSDGLLFIHGFNVTFEEALWRTTQLCHDLKFPGRKFCYSWASCGKVLSYPTDEATIDWSVAHLREFLRNITKNLGLKRLHIIAHSMGNRALLAVLENWETAPGETPISQIVLAAPDIDAGRFMQIAQVFGRYEQVTLYASRDDRAIQLSRTIKALPRAGDANPPLVMPDLSTVDVTAVAGELFGLGHSYIAATSAVFRDLYYIIQEGLAPEKRAGILKKDGYYILC